MYSDQFLAQLKTLVPEFPSPRSGLGRSPTKRLSVERFLIQNGLDDLLQTYGIFKVYYLIANGMADYPVCRNPGCGTRLSHKHKDGLYCGMRCYKSDPAAGKKISDRKTELYQDQNWKSEVEAKKRATCKKNFGVEFPMQSPSIFAKHEKSSMQAQEYKGIPGVRGFEPTVIDYLVDKGLRPAIDIIPGSQIMKQHSWQFIGKKGNRMFPDLYIPQWHTFIEVKSDYTLSKDLEKIKELPDLIENECGADYEVLLVSNREIFTIDMANPSLKKSNKFDKSALVSLAKLRGEV